MEDQKLELRLGPPGDNQYNSCGTKRGLLMSPLGHKSAMTTNPAVPSSSENRMVIASVVGWPPVRSFRKNLAGGGSPSKAEAAKKASVEPVGDGELVTENNNLESSLFVKINMDGVPIGRKIDLKAYNDYQTLSSAVDQLFRSLLAAQMNHSGIIDLEGEEMEETKAITGLLDGSGEYTLVYEDNEGDRMLVGDVPWNMFVSTAKRLRVLKKSELSSLQGKGRI